MDILNIGHWEVCQGCEFKVLGVFHCPWLLNSKLFIKFTFLKRKYQQCFFILYLHLIRMIFNLTNERIHCYFHDKWFTERIALLQVSLNLDVRVPSVPIRKGAVGIRWLLQDAAIRNTLEVLPGWWAGYAKGGEQFEICQPSYVTVFEFIFRYEHKSEAEDHGDLGEVWPTSCTPPPPNDPPWFCHRIIEIY